MSMQNYYIYFICANFNSKKMQNNRVFRNFVKSRLQNHPFLTTFLVSSKKSSTFAPALEICKFFSIAFAIYGVKLLLTHLAEIARWVFCI